MAEGTEAEATEETTDAVVEEVAIVEVTDETPATKTEPDWKALSKKAEQRAKQSHKRAEDLEARLKQFEDRDKTEQERAIEKARDEAAATVRAEVVGSFQQRILRAEIRARAAGKFANPAIAVKLVDLGDDAFTDDGEVNADAIDVAIGEILEAEPYLSITPPTPVKPNGSADAGKGKSAAAKALEEMSPEDHYRQIQAGS